MQLRLFRTSLAFSFLMVTLVSLAGANETETQQSENIQQFKKISERLEDFTPVFKAPHRGLFDPPEAKPQIVRLLGLDFAQDGESFSAGLIRIDSSSSLEITGYWLPTFTSLELPIPVSVHFWSHDCRFTRVVEISVGPASSEEPWLPGAVYKQTYTIRLDEISQTINGKCHMTVSLLSQKNSERAPVTLQYLVIYLSPNIRAGRIVTRNLKANSTFGDSFRDLSLSFRLGYLAEHTINIPKEFQSGNVKVALISAFSYGSIPQDNPVCNVIATAENGQDHTWILKSGVDTARADYDAARPGTQNHEKVSAFESSDADFLDYAGMTFKRYKYLCILEVPEEIDPIVSLKFRSINQYLFEIYDVVLIPEEDKK